MWMMGYTDEGEFNNNMQDSLNAGSGRLHPLMTRPTTSTNSPCLFHGGDLFALNHNLAIMAEQNKREINTQQVVVSSRWNPTPEQLHALEELYRKGTRTPSAEQIQQITVELRRYGKIEGKNVFYWFQNHKARERQKRRRQLESPSEEINPNNNNNYRGEKKESFMEGANRTVHEAEYWGSPTNSSTIAPEKTVTSTTQGGGASKATAEESSECYKAHGWVQFNDHDTEELLQQRKNATWQMMQHLSCNNFSSPTNLITMNPTTTTTVPTMNDLIINPTINPAQHNFVNIFLEPYDPENLNRHDGVAQTLQLFPLSGGVRGQSLNNEYWDETGGLENSSSGSAMNSTNGNSNYHFFEFLPLKN